MVLQNKILNGAILAIAFTFAGASTSYANRPSEAQKPVRHPLPLGNVLPTAASSPSSAPQSSARPAPARSSASKGLRGSSAPSGVEQPFLPILELNIPEVKRWRPKRPKSPVANIILGAQLASPEHYKALY